MTLQSKPRQQKNAKDLNQMYNDLNVMGWELKRQEKDYELEEILHKVANIVLALRDCQSLQNMGEEKYSKHLRQTLHKRVNHLFEVTKQFKQDSEFLHIKDDQK